MNYTNTKFNKTRLILVVALAVLLVASVVGLVLMTVNVMPVKAEGTAEIPTKTGYNFTGWYEDEDCTIPYTGDTITEDMTLYAGWEPITYTIRFDMGTYDSEQWDDVTLRYDESYTLPRSVSDRWFILMEYELRDTAGNWLPLEGKIQPIFNLGATINNLTATDGATVVLKLAGYWRDEYVVFNANFGITPETHGRGVSMNTESFPCEFTRDGYRCIGWAKTADGPVVLSLDSDAEDYADAGFPVSLYAVWEEADITYTIRFDCTASGDSMPDVTLAYDESYKLPAYSANANSTIKSYFLAMEYEFYDLDGNPLYVNNGSQYASVGATVQGLSNVDGDVIVARQSGTWYEHYIVTNCNYMIDDGYGVLINPENSSKGYLDSKDSHVAITNTFTREGYRFVGWALSADGPVVFQDGVSSAEYVSYCHADGVGSGSDILFAVWEEVVMCTVTFMVDGEVWKTVQVEYGTPSSEVIASAVNSALYEVDGTLPN